MCIRRCVTPFTKQCFVTLAVALNLMAHGFDIGFSSVLLTQLKNSQDIPTDDEAASWLASIVGLALIVGALLVPGFIRKYGRKVSYLASASLMTFGWFGITLATNIPCLLAMRFIQGIAMGLSGFLGYLMIGEYTTPRLRGAFLSTIAFAFQSGTLLSHALGAYLSWQRTAFICGMVGLIDTIMLLFSPETPNFLALKHRYDDCRKSFHWLRGYNEEEELEKLIKQNMINGENDNNKGIKEMLLSVKSSIKKREFYKPVLLLLVMFFWSLWSGGIMLDSYIHDIFDCVLGKDINYGLTLISLDTQRVLSNALAVVLFRVFTRRTMLVLSALFNVGSLFAIGLYVHARLNNWLPFDHVGIGIFLLHLYYFSISAGTIPLPNVVAGEITPLRYKEVNGMTSILFFSANLMISVKTAPSMFKSIGIDGAFFVYGSLVLFSSVIIWIFLPETKDKTLQDIEDELKDSYEDPNLRVDEEAVKVLKN